MKEKPRNIKESIINSKIAITSILQGILIFLVTFITYLSLIKNNVDTNTSITITYSILLLSVLLITYQIKDNNLTITNFIKSFKDKISLIINICVLLVLIILTYIPFFNKVANTTPLELTHWLYIIILTLLAILPFDFKKIRILLFK